MAFGITRAELRDWQKRVKSGEVAFLTHFWLDERFPGCDTVTKVGCSQLPVLKQWGAKYGLKPEWIHHDPRYPHFDLFGSTQSRIMRAEEQWEQIERFNL
ncbi:hypothetical protein [Thalassobacillus sp. CUG 92003]|uniref:hypothetical protein n=1 Tax=Thalassobacillus sp. CUG 92003 TaxID=2736641 RepID=UPI0015E64060|nr:hypothetical protein [Thalassobacillus sp. CUG 92003]